MVAIVDTDACTWCGKCLEACPYDAIEQVEVDGKAGRPGHQDGLQGLRRLRAGVPSDAIDLQGYTDAQIRP